MQRMRSKLANTLFDPVWVLILSILTAQNAYACISEDGNTSTPSVLIFMGSSVIVLVFAMALITAIWGVNRTFFQHRKKPSVLAIASIVLSIILGLFATFIVHDFVSLFNSLDTELPTTTALLVHFRYFLWSPLLLVTLFRPYLQLSVAKPYSYYFLTIFLSEIALLLFTVFALYMPIVKLGLICG